MDPVTLVALIGVVGTVIAALVGVVGAVRTAGINARAQASVEDLKSRRAAYSACAAALLAQRGAALRLMDVLNVPDLDADRAKKRVAQAQALHDDIGTTVGAVAVEGPEAVADAAMSAAERLSAWLDELAWWLEQGRPRHQREIITELSDHAEEKVQRFTAECREALHPDDGRSRSLGPLKRLSLRRYVRRHGGPYGWPGWD
ncbi:hypothetical protein [Streptomyces europaeiscabiei]|uniref:hypothetical protein n=1 Tax=Streptomyces europaeiscabiei TaxID=146819 RepID=UPI0029BF7965|nr:hypothetical protein [Streptomyces europaeiscabiei]MDX3866854.1 hypothetical protein [Streptomyces europaeiscabiei]MDX3873118.1 hypothetical protein [Streptomyces europaeiscabiei]